MTTEETIIFVIGGILIIFICGMMILEVFGPTEIKTISGEQYTDNFRGIVFQSDGGALYRIETFYLREYIFCPDHWSCKNHVTINVTLRKTYFDKKIIDAEGYTPPEPYQPPKCSDCGGIFVI
jgi:hypothetical protein